MWCRFGTIVKMRIGKTPPRGEQVYWSNGKHNWVSISDMVEGGTIKAVKEKVSDIAVNEIFKCYPTPKGYGHEIEMYTVEQGEKRDKRQ